jgi:flavorubredoxin
MVVREISPGIYAVGAIDWERRLFDALIPLPQGTSYNAYLVQGSEKTALIDTVDPSRELDLITNLVSLGVERIDYLVVNHAEQDHAGTVPMVLELYPGSKVLCSEKCRDLLVRLEGIDAERCEVVGDGTAITLGDRTLRFLSTPYVHWPETILTYEETSRFLFSCDLFGCHLATSELYCDDFLTIAQYSKRYFAEIMMPFRKSIAKYLDRIGGLPLAGIAPSHGPIYRDPAPVLAAYREWSGDCLSNHVVIPYVSMHGSVRLMVMRLCDTLMGAGVKVHPFDLTVTDIGDLATTLVDAATLVIGTPTVLFGAHPQVIGAAHLANLLRPRARFATVIGSYGWGGNAVDQIKGVLTHLEVEFLDPVMAHGAPDAKVLQDIDRLGMAIRDRHASLGLM